MKVLIVDDTATFRMILDDILKNIDIVDEVMSANDGQAALRKIDSYKPDLMILDLEMPELDGISTLKELNKNESNVGVIIFSAHSREGGETTLEALELGAFDFITKPEPGKYFDDMVEGIRRDLSLRVRAFHRQHSVKEIFKLQETGVEETQGLQKKFSQPTTPEKVQERADAKTFAVVGIGISTGGPEALAKIIPEFVADFRAPVLIVQHMPAGFTAALAERLNSVSAIKVKEAEDEEPVQAGIVYIAPGGRQMYVRKKAETVRIHLTDDPPHEFCRPSVDLLFRSMADVYGEQAIGVIMTGMGNDGSDGMSRIEKAGGFTIAQDSFSSLVYGMPGAAIEKGAVLKVVRLPNIVREINQLVHK